jgi:acetyltransferase-like isoleucine patch superfamily enzyme
MFEGDNCEIFIWENTTIESAYIDVKENNIKISIDENSMFLDEVFISTSDSHSIINTEGERINHAKSIIIGSNVCLGKRVMVLKGSIIEEGTIIAA